MRLSLVLPTLLVATGIFASAAAAAESAEVKTPITTTGLRASTTHQDARRTNRYWVAPVRNSGLTCIDNSIRAGGGKPNEICMTEGEALCIEYDYKPMGGRWQFGIKDSKLRLYDPKGEVVYEYCKDVTHLCIGEEHDFDPNRYSKERPYLTLYDEKTHKVVGSLTCDGTDGKNDENIGQSSILKLVDQADVGPYADYPLTLVKFRKGQTEDPKDDNSLWNITVTEPIAAATGLQLESFLNYNDDRCEWNSYVDSFEDLKRQIAAATDSDPDNRAKIEICEDRPIVFEDIIDFSDKYFEVSCLGDGCVFDLDGFSFVTPENNEAGSAFYAEFEGITFENGSSSKGRGGQTDYDPTFGGAIILRGSVPHGVRPDNSILTLKNCNFRNNVATADSGAIDNVHATIIAADTTFEDNVSEGFGGAIYTDGFASFRNCQFLGNSGLLGGAIFSVVDIEISESTLFQCNTAAVGGALFFIDGEFALSDVEIRANTAGAYGGGIVLADDSDSDIQNSRFYQNEAIGSAPPFFLFPFPGGGGAIAFAQNSDDHIAKHTLNGTVFQNNTSLTSPSDDLYDANGLVPFFNSTNNIGCGAGYGNCFCDADVNPLVAPNITTNDAPTTCAGDGVGSTCTGCASPPPLIVCPPISRAGGNDPTSVDDVDVASVLGDLSEMIRKKEGGRRRLLVSSS